MTRARNAQKPLSDLIINLSQYASQSADNLEKVNAAKVESARWIMEGFDFFKQDPAGINNIIGKVNRVFNSCPVMVDNITLEKWADEFIDSRINVKFKLDPDSPFGKSFVDESNQRIIALMDNFIKAAFANLISPDAQFGANAFELAIRQDVIDYLNWHDAKDEVNDKKLQMFIQNHLLHILKAFTEGAVECVIGHVALESKNADDPYTSRAEKYKNKIIPVINMQLAGLVLARMNYGDRIAAHLPTALALCIRRSQKTVTRQIADDLVKQLANTKPNEIDLAGLAYLINEDLSKSKEGAADRAEKLKFWLTIIIGCHKNKMNDVAAALMQQFNKNFHGKTFATPDTALFDEIAKQQFAEMQAIAIPKKEIAIELKVANKELAQFVNARDNAFLINHFHQFINVDLLYNHLMGKGGNNLGPRTELLRDQLVFRLNQIIGPRVYEKSGLENLKYAYDFLTNELTQMAAKNVIDDQFIQAKLLKALLFDLLIKYHYPFPTDAVVGARLNRTNVGVFEKQQTADFKMNPVAPAGLAASAPAILLRPDTKSPSSLAAAETPKSGASTSSLPSSTDSPPAPTSTSPSQKRSSS